MADAPSFTKLVPGFDFLQGLVKNAGAALPNIGQWVAPTLNPEELEKRIEELRTVQLWLEQNARMLGATIQALEVQRMTLSTLKTMNVSVSELGNAMKLRTASPSPQPSSGRGDKAAAPSGVVDPMQWWGALTQQFTQLAVQ
ncbi:MAG TPA: PhaM family polyhydroxyalkanoate granule multifunctional regulatory protein, partial [Albitalea sp.]|nr:PhaM family polyhydroxyalkanoate granule multifunctional regulatory protein [Albitalea sp.]